MDFNQYRPSPTWFAHNPFGIHGIGHAARVFVWVNRIGEELIKGGMNIDIEVVRWAAALHDVGRIADGIDRGHGERSAEWISRNRTVISLNLDDHQFEQLLSGCRWHETNDNEIPQMTNELKCLKDADGLDRVRLNDLNPNFLRSDVARELVKSAWDLYRATQAAKDPWSEVWKSAESSGEVRTGPNLQR